LQNTNEFVRAGEPTVVDLRSSEAKIGTGGRQAATGAESLYREHHAFVWRNARRLGCGDEWLEDAVHEVFLIAARRFPEFENRSSVRTWLFAIVLRVVQRMKRDRARYVSNVQAYSRATADEWAASPEARSESARYLRSLLTRLDEARRIVVILVELEGMTSVEVAEATGTKQGTVESRLRSARQRLQRMIEHDRRNFERRKR
jgi:RNA polymerase sigma-70 factor (ECF subfamily)